MATPDQEALVKNRVRAAIEMSIAVHSRMQVGADTDTYESAIEGIINGASVSVIKLLGMEPEYVNLRPPGHGKTMPVPASVMRGLSTSNEKVFSSIDHVKPSKPWPRK